MAVALGDSHSIAVVSEVKVRATRHQRMRLDTITQFVRVLGTQQQQVKGLSAAECIAASKHERYLYKNSTNLHKQHRSCYASVTQVSHNAVIIIQRRCCCLSYLESISRERWE
jgi:hypothetical protein